MTPPRTKRDGLAWLFFAVHLGALGFIVLDWAAPWRGVLLFYLIFLPATVLQWTLNAGTCILNNLENWLRHRRWRAPDKNPEEGAWLRTLIRDATGIALTKGQANLLNYGAIFLFWALGMSRFLAFQGA